MGVGKAGCGVADRGGVTCISLVVLVVDVYECCRLQLM